MLAATLQHLNAAGLLTARQASLATGMDDRSFYRWMSGETEPQFTTICLLFRGCNEPAVQQAILGLMTAGTDWTAHRIPAELDIDGDGQINEADALEAVASSVEVCGREIAELAKLKPERLSDAVRAHLESQTDKAIAALVAARRIIGVMHQREQAAALKSGPRKRCTKPLPSLSLDGGAQ